MGMTEKQLGLMRPRTFENKYKGWKAQILEDSALSRLNTFILAKSSGVKNIHSPHQLYTLEGYDTTTGGLRPHFSPEELEDLKRIWKMKVVPPNEVN